MDAESKNTILFAGGLGLLLLGASQQETPAQLPDTTPPSTPAQPGSGGYTPIRQSFYLELDREINQVCAPGLLSLKETYGTGTTPSTFAKWPVCTGRSGQYQSGQAPLSLLYPYPTPALKPGDPVTIFGDPKRFVYQVTGELVYAPITQNPTFQSEFGAYHNPAWYTYYQWQAPIALWDLAQSSAYPIGGHNTLVIQDETAQAFANTNGLPMPMIGSSVTIRASSKDKNNIASLLNQALTRNKAKGMMFAIQFNE